jgi:hypothetical protein
MEIEDPFATLIKELSKGFSWRLITQVLMIALLGIPILKLYIFFVPEFFPTSPKPPIMEPKLRYVLVPASKLWVNSGIRIQPKQKITMRASGYVNLAIHRLISSAEADVPPPYAWSGPEGTVLDGNCPLYKRREELLIEKRALLGQLLYVAVRDSEVPPSVNNPRPERIHALKSGNAYANISTERETLYFTVNEKLVENSPKAKLAFVGKNQMEIDQTYGPGKFTQKQLTKQFDNIIYNRYWTVWFDDNVGQFLVEVEHNDI